MFMWLQKNEHPALMGRATAEKQSIPDLVPRNPSLLWCWVQVRVAVTTLMELGRVVPSVVLFVG